MVLFRIIHLTSHKEGSLKLTLRFIFVLLTSASDGSLVFCAEKKNAFQGSMQWNKSKKLRSVGEIWKPPRYQSFSNRRKANLFAVKRCLLLELSSLFTLYCIIVTESKASGIAYLNTWAIGRIKTEAHFMIQSEIIEFRNEMCRNPKMQQN